VKPGDVSPSSRYWQRDVVTPEWTMTDRGTMVVPEGAGLGVDVDVGRVDDLTVRKVVVNRAT
jgi:O-succinylbenzoate synthase